MRHRERARMGAAMIEKFTKDVYNSLVLDRTDIYRRMYNSMTEETGGDEYWSDLKEFYDTLSDRQKEVFFRVIKQTIIDSISGVFGVLDGSSNLGGTTYECDVMVDGVDMEHDLQDYFLSYVEEAEQ